MALKKALYQGWQRIREALVPDHYQQLLALLRQQYAAEICDVAQLKQCAQQMHYPQFREKLLQIAHEDQTHVHWLQEKILGLDGDLPTVSCTPRIGKNSWECLRLALEDEKRSCATLLECIHQADRVDPAIAAELRRWRAQAKRHCDEIMSMVMKSDPYALPPPLTSHQEQQRQEWPAQQKVAWLDQERTRRRQESQTGHLKRESLPTQTADRSEPNAGSRRRDEDSVMKAERRNNHDPSHLSVAGEARA
jgi:bacterioferritin (cytochrome b1)